MALKCISLAPASLAHLATFSAPFHCMSLKSCVEPCMIPTSDTTTSAFWKAGGMVPFLVMSTGTGGKRRS